MSAPKDGSVFYAVVRVQMKWKPYKPTSQQARHGLEGRWVQSNGYGGWDVADYVPDEWEPLQAQGVAARSRSDAPKGQQDPSEGSVR